ncbi:MAG: radical SAM protein [Planctomycetes bacterium]|nr:radical SAM protein [Planctomycetota bacterium]
MKPTDAVLAVTYRCNARCVMCDIWKSNSSQSAALEPRDYARLPTSLKNINISGGEPFLRNDLPEVVEVITKRCPNARLVFSTNGLSPALVKKSLPKVLKVNPEVSIRFSVDGIGKIHQEMRGIEGAFDRVMSSLNIALDLGVKDAGLSYTATNTNLDQLLAIYYLTQQKKVNFTFCGVAHNSEIEGYFTQGNKEINDLELLGQQLNYLVKKHLQTWDPNLLARAYYEYGIYFREVYKKRPLYCGAADVLFYMDPFGNIFSCNIANKLMGNIVDSDFEIIWKSTEADNSRIFAKKCPHQCWMICTVSPYLKKRPIIPLLWILVNKIKLALGKEVIEVSNSRAIV